MAASTTDRNTPKRGNDLLSIPVAAATKIPAGVMAARSSTGYAVNAADVAGLRVIGRSNALADNSAGTAGLIAAEVERGVFLWENDEANPVTIAHVGEVCYVLDNQTVSSDPGDESIIAGIVQEVTSGGVWVDTSNAIVPGPTGATGPTGA